jgi:hypothetical protein
MLARTLSSAPSGLPTGLDYLKEIAGLSGKAREDVTLRYVRERWIPPSMLDFTAWPVVSLAAKDSLGHDHVLEAQVSPDFFKVGSDEATAVMAPMWPTTAQKVADELKVRTVGKPLARAIYKHAKIKGSLDGSNPGEPYYDLKAHTPRNIEDSGAWAASAKKRQRLLDQQVPLDKRASTLIDGHAKNVVQQASGQVGGKAVSGSKLAIYGGASGTNDGWAIQPFPGPHVWSYGPDYSHGVRFARNRAKLDGGASRLDDIAKSSTLYTFLSEVGPFNNRMSMPQAGMALAGGEVDLDEAYVPTGRQGDEDAPADGEGGEGGEGDEGAGGGDAVVWVVGGGLALAIAAVVFR